MGRKRDLRVLVIDDSAYNRRILSEIIEETPGMTLVGKALDGDEGLKLALTQKPDVITLDLEMPRMDGFTFLRLLMKKRPTPVIVISSHNDREKVFRALELGALDFVAKPTHLASPQILGIKDEVIQKLRLAKSSKLSTIPPPPTLLQPGEERSVHAGDPSRAAGSLGELQTAAPIIDEERTANRVIAMAASTGGPTAVTHILTALPADLRAGITIVQHMPSPFTTTFAERLDKLCKIRVKEASFAEPLLEGTAYIAPGSTCLEVIAADKGLTIHAAQPTGEERYLPSANRLFISVARSVGANALAIVLTGMGDDGTKGVQAISAAGGQTVAEDETTATISGMPRSAILSGAINRIIPVYQIAKVIKEFARGGVN